MCGYRCDVGVLEIPTTDQLTSYLEIVVRCSIAYVVRSGRTNAFNFNIDPSAIRLALAVMHADGHAYDETQLREDVTNLDDDDAGSSLGRLAGELTPHGKQGFLHRMATIALRGRPDEPSRAPSPGRDRGRIGHVGTTHQRHPRRGVARVRSRLTNLIAESAAIGQQPTAAGGPATTPGSLSSAALAGRDQCRQRRAVDVVVDMHTAAEALDDLTASAVALTELPITAGPIHIVGVNDEVGDTHGHGLRRAHVRRGGVGVRGGVPPARGPLFSVGRTRRRRQQRSVG